MKRFPLTIALLASAVLSGCATADFTPYVGEQQRWPTAKGAFVTTIDSYDGPGRSGTGQQYTLPVYFGPPNRPYVVLGSVDVDTPGGKIVRRVRTRSDVKASCQSGGTAWCGCHHCDCSGRGDARIQHDGFRARAVHHELQRLRLRQQHLRPCRYHRKCMGFKFHDAESPG